MLRRRGSAPNGGSGRPGRIRPVRKLPVRLQAVARRVGGWDYRGTPEGAGKRDLRIDLLRGFCVFVMIVDHIGGEASWLYVLTGGNQFIVSAAEGFVLLSGFSMGMVHHLTIRRSGVRAMLGKVFGRVWLLYLLTVTLTITFATVSSLLDTPWAAEATPSARGAPRSDADRRSHSSRWTPRS